MSQMSEHMHIVVGQWSTDRSRKELPGRSAYTILSLPPRVGLGGGGGWDRGNEFIIWVMLISLVVYIIWPNSNEARLLTHQAGKIWWLWRQTTPTSWPQPIRPVGIRGHLQGENIQSYNLFGPVLCSCTIRKLLMKVLTRRIVVEMLIMW